MKVDLHDVEPQDLHAARVTATGGRTAVTVPDDWHGSDVFVVRRLPERSAPR